MSEARDAGVSRQVLINSLILVIVVAVALVLYFVFGRRPTPVFDANAVSLLHGL